MSAPPALSPSLRPAGAVRVVVGLLLFGLLDLGVQAYSLFAWVKTGGNLSLTAPFSTLALGLAAWLVWRGNRAIWSVLLYLAPIGLGLILGMVLAGWLFLPWRLLRVVALHAPDLIAVYLVYLFVVALLFGWLAWEASRFFRGATPPRQVWTRAPALAAYGALPAILFIKLVLFLLQGSWTADAVALARAQLGETYDYQVMSWQMQKQGDTATGHAVVLAYNDHEIRQVQVRW